MRDWFPGIDDLLLEFVEETIILLSLFFVGSHLVNVLTLVPHLTTIIITFIDLIDCYIPRTIIIAIFLGIINPILIAI